MRCCCASWLASVTTCRGNARRLEVSFLLSVAAARSDYCPVHQCTDAGTSDLSADVCGSTCAQNSRFPLFSFLLSASPIMHTRSLGMACAEAVQRLLRPERELNFDSIPTEGTAIVRAIARCVSCGCRPVSERFG